MEGNSIIGMAGGFIALSIMLGIGTLILGGSVTDCTQINDYLAINDDGGRGAFYLDSSNSTREGTTDHNQTGWAAQCYTANQQSQSGYGLLMVSLIVLAAAVVLIVVRMLSG